ncbi:WhiB-family transcriptional regulator (fragment) [uncultured Mycobacterium sp.]|uniref:WhiB-family transcriptional regulator n=1 Tax=uncultured Mycobacterium sp. TaxID=171292 RepID=A0A1Y5PCL9_9MYCO
MSAKPGVAQARHKKLPSRTNVSWQQYAHCVDSDPRIFFDPTCYAQALLVCRECPVKPQCRAYSRGAPGVWGGQVNEEKQ